MDYSAVGEDVGGRFSFGGRFAGAAAPSPSGDGEDPVYFVVLCFISRDLDYGKGIGYKCSSCSGYGERQPDVRGGR